MSSNLTLISAVDFVFRRPSRLAGQQDQEDTDWLTIFLGNWCYKLCVIREFHL